MPMMVFDHQHCRWRPWHGSRAAWLRLPHAVATGLCLLGTATLPASAPLPRHPPAPHPAPAVATAAGPAVAIFLPTPWVGGIVTSGGAPVPVGGPMLLGGGGTGGGGGTDGGGPTPAPGLPAPPPITATTTLTPTQPRTPVPEPGSAAVLAVASLALILLRRHSATRPPKL